MPSGWRALADAGRLWCARPVSVVAIVVIELVLRRRRKERRTSTDLSGR